MHFSQSNFSPSRRLRRLYSEQSLQSADSVTLSIEESRHALRSLRLQIGDICLLVDGQGWEAQARLQQTQNDLALFSILSRNREARGFPIPVTVLPALIKKGKMDTLVEKAQEFGVAAFQPLECERSEMNIAVNRFSAVELRWQKIAREAAKQSSASQVLSILPPIRFEKALKSLESDALALIFHPHEPAQDWTGAASEIVSKKEKYSKIYIFTGPEGGFSKREVEAAVKYAQVRVVCMSKTVLRADTALVAALAGIPFFLSE